MEPSRHGLNRDAVRVGLIGSQVGVIAVADGCGLTYWSEIAAHIAVNEFMMIVEKRLANEHPPYAPGAMRLFLREAIHSVNQSMLTWKHPKLKSKCNVLDKGGNTTLVVAIVFPYVDDDTTTANAETSKAEDAAAHAASSGPSSSSAPPHDSITHQSPKQADSSTASPAKAPSRKLSSGSRHSEGERKFGVVFTGMGDSELYLFKVHEPERAAKGKGSSANIVAPSPSVPTTSVPSTSSHHTDDSDAHSSSSKPGHVRTGTGDSSGSAGGSASELSGKPSQDGASKSNKTKHLKTSSKEPNKVNKFMSALAGSFTSPSKPNPPTAPTTPAATSSEVISAPPDQESSHSRPKTIEAPVSATQAEPSSPSSPRSSGSPGASPRAELTMSSDAFVSGDTAAHSRDSRSPRAPEIGHQRDAQEATESPAALPRDTSPLQPSASSKTTEDIAESSDKKVVTRSAPSKSAGHASSPSSSLAPPHQPPPLDELPEDDFDAEGSDMQAIQRDLSNASIDSNTKVKKKSSSTSSKPEKPDEKSRSRGSSPPRRQSPPRALSPPVRSLSKDDASVYGERKKSQLETEGGSENDPDVIPQDLSTEATPSRVPRSARYSKSFSDIPSFESLGQELPAPMYRSESLAIDIDSARRAQTTDDANAGDARLSSSPGSATPRAPCGIWLKLLSDSGRSPFLPFPGLKDRSIPEPNFIALNPGDSVFACSDGVLSSYPDGILWPDISHDQYDCKDGLDYATHALINSTMTHHRLSNTDPDDVTIGAIKLTTHAKKSKSDALRVSPVRDLTSTFAPQFASTVYHREYLNDFLCEYPKPKDKPS